MPITRITAITGSRDNSDNACVLLSRYRVIAFCQSERPLRNASAGYGILAPPTAAPHMPARCLCLGAIREKALPQAATWPGHRHAAPLPHGRREKIRESETSNQSPPALYFDTRRYGGINLRGPNRRKET